MAKWIIGQTNEWMSEWMNLDLLKWNSNETAAMHRKFLPLWQFHKLRHSTINKWRRYNRKCTCIVQKNKADRVRRGEGAERDRVMKASRGNRQAGSFKEFVKRQSLSLIMRFREAPPPPPTNTVPCSLSCMLVKTRRQFFSRIAAAVYGNCVTQRRKANAKKPKATGRMTCENMQMQNIQSEWIELSLVYGSVCATARRRVAGVSGVSLWCSAGVGEIGVTATALPPH